MTSLEPSVLIIQEVEMPDRTIIRQCKETYPNGQVGYRIVKTLGFKVLNTGALFIQLKSDRLFAKTTNVRGAVQRF